MNDDPNDPEWPEDIDVERWMEIIKASGPLPEPERLIPSGYSADRLREELEEILAETQGAASGYSEDLPRYNVEREIQAGRVSFQLARLSASMALEKLDAQDLVLAKILLGKAKDFLLDAYRKKLTAKHRQKLAPPALGGRPPDPLVDRLVAAVDELQAAGLTPKDARSEAINANPELKRAYGDKPPDTVKKAIQRARKSSGTK